MTAEIAILNKTAVALATDSAVTISGGQAEEKIFDSGDKLFELSFQNPLGIMIYNDMQFAEIPLPTIIQDFRDKCPKVNRVQEAADRFLKYLYQVGHAASDRVQTANLFRIVDPILKKMEKAFRDSVLQSLVTGHQAGNVNLDEVDAPAIGTATMEKVINRFERSLKGRKSGSFVGGSPSFSNKDREFILAGINNYFSGIPEEQKQRIISYFEGLLLSDYMSYSLTGIVIAGFGNKDRFPTLVCVEIDGMILGRLKMREVRVCDIDRDGERAAVLPFAQKEMVDRFLYGLDDEISKEISEFAKKTISTIGESIQKDVEFDDTESEENFYGRITTAEEAFLTGLKEDAFKAIRNKSKTAIEDVVEFMPKPEVARMAEALVQLTSIKRRVSRGMETVREPIDVAVISRAEGFIWVKRKHYFNATENPRYLQRFSEAMRNRRQNHDQLAGEGGLARKRSKPIRAKKTTGKQRVARSDNQDSKADKGGFRQQQRAGAGDDGKAQ